MAGKYGVSAEEKMSLIQKYMESGIWMAVTVIFESSVPRAVKC